LKAVLNTLREKIFAIQKKTPLIIAVDGADGAGKTFFSHHLKECLEEGGKEVIIIAIDNFHNPKSIRYKQGEDSPSDFYYDSYNYDGFIENVILPFQQQDGKYVTKVFDLDQDKPVTEKPNEVPQNAVLIVEGIFLNRPELATLWDYSIYLEVSVETSLARNIKRSNAENDFEKMKEIERKFFLRYRPGQQLYILQANPINKASIVIDNNDYLNPRIIDKEYLPSN
jgi:uridine kinase